MKLPSIPKSPAGKDKHSPKLSPKTNGESPKAPPKASEEKDKDQFDGVDVQTEKLSHPTANRAKPPQRRPPTAPTPAAQENESDKKETEFSPKKFQENKLPDVKKPTDNVLVSPAKPDHGPKTPPPSRPAPPKVLVDGRTTLGRPTVDSLQAEVMELRMALELLQTQHRQDMQEVKEELREERSRRVALQDEILALRMRK